MKKVLIVLLSVLLALSFVSCESDKSEEIIANYEAFKKAYPVAYGAVYTLSNNATWTSATGEIDNSFSDKSISDGSYWCIAYLIRNLTSDKYVYEDGIVSATLKSGKLTGQRNLETKVYDVTVSDVVLEVTYKPDTSSDKTETTEFKMNGNFTKYSDGKKNELACNLTVNNVECNVSYTIEYGDKTQYTSAKVNGKDVELRLLNAGY